MTFLKRDLNQIKPVAAVAAMCQNGLRTSFRSVIYRLLLDIFDFGVYTYVFWPRI